MSIQKQLGGEVTEVKKEPTVSRGSHPKNSHRYLPRDDEYGDLATHIIIDTNRPSE